MDERVHLVSCLSDLVRNRPDDEEVALTTLRTPVSATSGLSVDGSGRAAASDVLLACGLTIPKTIGEVRNTIRWLNAVIAPAPVLGNYAQLLGREWAPGRLSDTDKRSVAKFNDEDVYSSASGATVLRGLDFRGVLDDNTPQVLRDQADHFIDQILSHRVALLWGESVARTLSFQGASGAYELSALEAKQWTLAAFLLQIDPDFPGRPGTLVGYDIYQAGNNGRTIASVRADVEAHLSKNPLLDAQTTPLAAHLFLASSAPEFLVKGIPPTLRMGSAQWTDFRLGVAFAERQGGPGSSRAMSYDEIMALSKLEPMTDDQTAVLTNHGIDALLDWAVMQGVFAKPTDGVYTPQHYQQASKAFQAQNEQLVQALQVFNVPLPTRRDLAISQLRKVFPEHSVEQLKALTVYIADPAERRNQKPSEPVTRSLVETYMTGELVKDRWMLLAPGEQPPQLPKANSPFDIHRRLQPADQAAVDQNVRDLNARIADLPDVQAQLPDKVDAYLAALKQGLSTTTRKMIAELPLADRQALEYGEVELFALREQTDAVLTLEQTSAQVEERRGRQGTLIRCVHNGAVSYFEVFAAKMLIVKREDLPAQLTLGGTLENHQKTYGRWAPTDVQTQNGAPEPFDFAAYTSDAGPRAGMTSPGIIIDKLGDTLPALDSRHADSPVPNSFASARSQAIVERIMQGNFIHHRDTVLKIAQDELPIEQAREVSQRNKALFLSMIPFVGAIVDLVNGNIVEGSRGLIIDTFAALLGGAGTTVRSLAKATKAVAPFGAKAFSVLAKGVLVVSAFLNPLDGTADLIRWGSKGLLTLPQTVAKAPKLSAVTKMVAVEEKLRTFFGVKSALGEAAILQEGVGQRSTHNGHNHSVPVQALQANGHWYAVNPQTGLPISTPLDGFTPLSST
ncbi:hypothetical protein BFW88_15095 [Pseudomonas fluorescens]|nr:hypothetical protein BFW88_15095 [Pseudomonas fluorescens]OPB10698.1 hypothetical protein BFW92_12755 [Pseudomonas fluorescens]OPB20210.1 hypothetical protein BFW93_15070 [Pseudomonas fluorescens]